MRFVNLTPHDIVVRDADGRREDIVLTPSGVVARVATTQKTMYDVDGIPVCRTIYGEVVDLPEPQQGVLYITSTLVMQAARREDVVSPDTGASAIRENGRIVAVTGFQTL